MTFVAVTALSAAVAAAAPTVVSADLDLGTYNVPSDKQGQTVTTDFSFTTVPGQESVLLVGVGGEDTNLDNDMNISAVWDTTDDNIAGVLLTSQIGARSTYILAFDLGDATGKTANISITGDTGYSNQGYGASAIQIAGATMPTTVQAASDNNNNPSLSFLGVPAGSVYFDVVAVNSSPGNITKIDGLTRDASATQSGFSAGMGSSYAEGVSGDITAGYSTSRIDDVALSGVYVVPEPATMSLLALGGLVALRRRRK
jgi:hypothetical protein